MLTRKQKHTTRNDPAFSKKRSQYLVSSKEYQDEKRHDKEKKAINEKQVRKSTDRRQVEKDPNSY